MKKKLEEQEAFAEKMEIMKEQYDTSQALNSQVEYIIKCGLLVQDEKGNLSVPQ